MFVVGLLRVSTNDQALGLEAQRASVEALAAREGLSVSFWVEERGVSGMLPLGAREGLLEAVRVLRENGGGILMVAEGSRVSRNPLTHLLVENQLQAVGARILSAKGEGYGSTSATDVFTSRVLMAQRELEANLTRERTRAALKVLKEKKNGRYFNGRARFGFQVVDGRLVPHPTNWMVVASWLLRRHKGETFASIAEDYDQSFQFIAKTIDRYVSITGLIGFTEKEAPGSSAVFQEALQPHFNLLEASLSAG